ncbi:unnamed protein product [Auanema sp. JU1783]|nr:unnamed protein product [Auanema sp. JU1783]
MVRPQVFLDIKIDDCPPTRVTIELFYDHVPKTAENFRALCTGEKGNSENGTLLQYTGCFLDMIFPDYIIQGGDITHGRGNESIYGDKFDDENFLARHTGAGILSMANSGPNTNGSQFMISVVENTLLDGKHVVFGRVVEGMDFLMELNSLGTESGKPTAQCYIADSGQL